MDRNLGKLDGTAFRGAHNDTMYVQTILPGLGPDQIKPDTFAYPPCWGVLDAGMTMEKHAHAIPEFYVFVQGSGTMVLGERTLEVEAGCSVNIPPNVDHEVTNPDKATQPLVWVSIGLTEE